MSLHDILFQKYMLYISISSLFDVMAGYISFKTTLSLSLSFSSSISPSFTFIYLLQTFSWTITSETKNARNSLLITLTISCHFWLHARNFKLSRYESNPANWMLVHGVHLPGFVKVGLVVLTVHQVPYQIPKCFVVLTGYLKYK